MAYAYHQPRLLAHFGFETLAGILAWYLALAGTTLAPLAGDASDRLVRSGANRFPVVRAGVALAAASFVAVAVTARAGGDSPVRFVLPLFVAVWIAGMTVFQAPALAIVRDGADARDLPSAMVPIVLATTVPMAVWPWLEPVLEQSGGTLTFLAGGVAVVGTTVALGATVEVARDERGVTAEPPVAPSPAWAFAFGVASAVVVLLATELVPAVLAERAGLGGSWLAALTMLVGSAVVPLAPRVAAALGSGRALALGVAIAALGRVVAIPVGGVGAALAIAVVTGLGLGLHLATALPFALSSAPTGRAGLTTGLYVAGAMLGSRVVHTLLA